jgi:Ricin-type beta-trefoil lectin domain-like
MRGKRSARSRSRGSWAPRLAGTGFALLLAVAGVAAYLIVGGAHGSKDASVLPTRVMGTQAVGIVNGGPASQANPAPEALVAPHSDLVFTVNGPAGVQWTSDEMAGGTYIFIYLPNGLCLAALQVPHAAAAVTLERCDLQADQRWLRQQPSVSPNGLDYWQLRNMADGRCLAAGTAISKGESPAQLARCQASPGWRQQIAFPTTS